MKDFRDFKVWKKSRELVLETYADSRGFPADERFGLTSHLRKTVISIPSNIAEGCGRDSDRDFARFLTIAMGSASEARYQILLAHDLRYLSEGRYKVLDSLVREVKRMLAGLINTLS